jgi:hypothetical protein
MRKPLIISAILGSVFIGGCILAGAAMLEVKPTPQHVEVQIKCDSEPCKVSAK